MEVVQPPRLIRRTPSFPQFGLLPKKIQLKIWNYAMINRGSHYILLTATNRRVLQGPPALAHVCRMSREVAFKNGNVYALQDGTRTWFCPNTDFAIWDFVNPGLGELTSVVKNIAFRRELICTYTRADEIFELFFGGGDVSQVENIYIALEFAFTNDSWNPEAMSRLFGVNKIVVPDLETPGTLNTRIQALVPRLPPAVAARWSRASVPFQIPNTNYDYMYIECLAVVTECWLQACGRFCNEISDDQMGAYERMQLMHPTGITWWEYFMDMMPTCIPTFMFLQTM